MRFAVMKYGGTSVKGRVEWDTIRTEVDKKRAAGMTPVLVCSALSGMTNLLEDVLAGAARGVHEETLGDFRRRHEAFAKDLGLDGLGDAEMYLADLERLVKGAALVEEVSPRLRARAMSAGELLSTTLGAAYLRKAGLSVAFVDAREHLVTTESGTLPRTYLSATCDITLDEGMRAALSDLGADVFVTQGFIARRPDGHTALLGRGGSDTSAAYFAAQIGAEVCEIWTDVPGVFTANPRDIPEARLLRALDYEEAQEIATTGAKVLHPRCLLPVRKAGIPVHIRCTQKPEAEGTVITRNPPSGGARVKAISHKRNITLVSLNTLGMWQQVGFLADVFGAFKTHGVSVDLVSTSEANVTCSIDAGAQALDDDQLRGLATELSTLGRVTVIEHCAALSLVGQNIRAILHKLGPALGVFEEQRIHLVSQAASDLNFTFVIDEDQADRLVKKLHTLLFSGVHTTDELLGRTWAQIFDQEEPEAADPVTRWWTGRRQELLDLAAQGPTPTYVYNRPTLLAACDQVQSIKPVDRVFFAIKANPHPEILRTFVERGLGLECVSPGELGHVFELFPDLDPQRVLFTPNFAHPDEYTAAFDKGVRVNVDNLGVLEQAPAVFEGRSFSLRLDPGKGQGHHAHVRTAGKRSKFGITLGEVERAAGVVKKLGAHVIGLHAHAGSGIRQPDSWAQTADFLLEARRHFDEVTFLDLGGGLGVVEKPGQSPLDIGALSAHLAEVKAETPDVELWLEPGRFMVARAGVILARVNQTKQKDDIQYVGIDAGMHTLIRPALYGAYHHIVNLTRLDEPMAMVANVVGPICETGDTLGTARPLPHTVPGDILLIATAGAYGAVMSSRYNLRGFPAEQVLE